MTVRWHGEFKSPNSTGIDTDEDGTGEVIDLYKSNDKGETWVFVKQLFNRTEMGWDKMERAGLIILPNGTWLCYVAADTDATGWRVVLIKSNDNGDTWTVVSTQLTPIGTKYPHPYLLDNGTLLLAYGYFSGSETHYLNKSSDYIDFSSSVAVFPSGWYCVSFTKASDEYYYIVHHTKYSNDDLRGEIPLVPQLSRTKDFKSYETVNETIIDLGPYGSLTMGGLQYSTPIEINGKIYIFAETKATDHDGKEINITDKTQRHLVRLKDPVTTIIIPTVNTSIPGTLNLGYVAPEVLTINLYNTSWAEQISIDPYVEYWLNMTIRHNGTLYSLKNITIYMYADGYSWDSLDDPNTHATFVWDNTTKQYSLIGPTDTTWSVIAANCSVPDQSKNTGTFTLAFRMSKIALMGTWHINVTAWGVQDLSDTLEVTKTVNFYSEISLVDTSFEFSLTVGTNNGSLTSPADGNIEFSVICNAPYNVSFFTNGNWTSDGNEIDITNTNYFIGDDDSDPTDTTEGGSIAEFVIHPTPYITTPYYSVPATQDDINGDSYTIYLFQTVPSGTAEGTYTLILYVRVVQA
ncbi:MAG: hypothetical protein DRJ03_10105 [Chloroflexi bacterium]|nr:MAG: hypothetical protein DRJ03_10105 [Chloroflexota bacterium]